MKQFTLLSGKLIAATLLIPAIITLHTSCKKESEKEKETPPPVNNEYYVPAEFEPLNSIWLSSPTVNYKEGWSMLDVQANMIKELITSVKVDYAINDNTNKEALINALLDKGVSRETIDNQVRFHTVSHGDLWIRDTGGTFKKNAEGKYTVVDFDFDAYRTKNYIPAATYALYQLDNDVSYGVAASYDSRVESSWLIAEGGNLHFNGKGTLITVKKSLMMSNPGKTIDQIDAELKRVFGLKKIIYLNTSLPTDGHPALDFPKIVNNENTFGFGVWHVDELCTWINDHTVILPEVPAAAVASGDAYAIAADAPLDGAFATLSGSTNQDGVPLTIVRSVEPKPIQVELQQADLMYTTLKDMHGLQGFPQNGAPIKFTLAASYMNYVVTNSVILIAKLYKPGRDQSLQDSDEAFRQLMIAQFPGRRVVQIDVDAITVGGGGMHCITQQVPKL